MKFSLLGGLFFAGLMSILLNGCGQTEVLDSGYDIRERGFISDTMAVLNISYWDHVKKGAMLMSSSDDYYVTTGHGLLFVDMRYEKIYAEKKLNSDLGMTKMDQILDSLLIFWDYTSNQEDGYKIVKAAYSNVYEDRGQILLDLDSTADSTDYLSLWKSNSLNNFMVFSIHEQAVGLGFYNKYLFALDIDERKLKNWIPTGSSSWMSQCADIQWTQKYFRCIKVQEQSLEIVDENQNVLDSLHLEKSSSVRFFGNFVSVGDSLYKLNNSGFIASNPSYTIISTSKSRFEMSDSLGNTVYYSGYSSGEK